jgi:hypothetical protein
MLRVPAMKKPGLRISIGYFGDPAVFIRASYGDEMKKPGLRISG